MEDDKAEERDSQPYRFKDYHSSMQPSTTIPPKPVCKVRKPSSVYYVFPEKKTEAMKVEGGRDIPL
jgi:hypothetical protein